MIMRTNRQVLVGAVVSTVLIAGCVSKTKYDALETENRQLHQQLTAQQAQVGRLQGAIKYTVNSDLLFSPGSWEMKKAGKDVIAKLASKLAPTQQNKLVVNGYTDNAPIGAGLKKKGVASNEELSQKRAESVMAFLVSQGVKQDLASAHGYGDANPVAPNTTAKGRAENRRVELTLGGPAS
jgi:chemotaxis protein MotB